MMMAMPLQQGQQHQLEDGNNQLEQEQQCYCRPRAMAPLFQGQ
jgi:hypothetical protein